MKYLCDTCNKKQVIEGQEYCWHGGKPLYLFDKVMLTLFGCEYEAWHRMEEERVREKIVRWREEQG